MPVPVKNQPLERGRESRNQNNFTLCGGVHVRSTIAGVLTARWVTLPVLRALAQSFNEMPAQLSLFFEDCLSATHPTAD
ncbi:hypothetical protein QUB68_16875 [Microcoleus sp. A006_D1]|uniref:hypothetical protein n=1 Tax=Microcoleus sp. A006_D1 TaxID=3055267 RepID=UPI002FD58343